MSVLVCENQERRQSHQGDIMSEEYVIEIESFNSIKAARDFAKSHISKSKRQINIVSRDIIVVDLEETT
jgi:hypothetical protein